VIREEGTREVPLRRDLSRGDRLVPRLKSGIEISASLCWMRMVDFQPP